MMEKYKDYKNLGGGVKRHKLNLSSIEEDFKFQDLGALNDFLMQLGWAVRPKLILFHKRVLVESGYQESSAFGYHSSTERYEAIQVNLEVIQVTCTFSNCFFEYVVVRRSSGNLHIEQVPENPVNKSDLFVKSNKLFREGEAS